MILTSFGYRNLKYTCNNLFYLITTSILLGGFLYLINIEYSYDNTGLIFYSNGLSLNFIMSLIIAPLALYIYIKQTKQLKNNYSNYYDIIIYFKDGKKIEMNIKVGDKVITSKYSGTEISVEGKNYLMMRQSDILAIM